MSVAETPVAVVLETREGQPTLGGKRRLLDDFEGAAGVADELGGAVYAIEEVVTDPPFPPVSVSSVRDAFPLPVFTETNR